jgi:8-oxo-dGTP pyrophosphatase MutT (NUDIX family)
VTENPFLTDVTPLRASDAVAALLLLEDDRYLLQQRDQRHGIWFPGHWGLFGGSIDPGEAPGEALLRELREELELVPSAPAEPFTCFHFDLRPLGQELVFREYFVVRVGSAEIAGLRLHEGRAMGAFSAAEIWGGGLQVTPYDGFALWLHSSRHRLSSGGGTVAFRPQE